MIPAERKQLPRSLHYLILKELDQDDSFCAYIGDCRPTYIPIFEKGVLAGIFYSWQSKFVFSRKRVGSESWPQEHIYINREKLVHSWRLKRAEIGPDLLLHNARSAHYTINPQLDARLLWDRPQLLKDQKCSNIDFWADLTMARLDALKNDTATSFCSGRTNMAMIGVMFSILACVDRRADSPNYLHEFDDIINKEADAYFRSNYNYAWKFSIAYKSEVNDFPYLDYVTETMLVKVPVPEYLSPLLRTGHKVPFYRGHTYVGIKHFKAVARHMFVSDWKRFALRLLASLLPLGDNLPLDEFMETVKFKKRATSIFEESSASLLFPVVHQSAPPCIRTLLATQPLKHYARWQLAELAVEMGWSLNNLMAHYPDNARNRNEVSSAYKGYQKKPIAPNRCKMFMAKGLCPYTASTCQQCAESASADIEDLRPSQFFQRRLQAYKK